MNVLPLHPRRLLFPVIIFLWEINWCWVDTARWDRAWRWQVDVRVEEPAGLARANEPVELRLPAAGLPLERWRREMRVVELPAGKEVSSQVLAAPGKEQVAVAFSSTLGPKHKRAYRIYFNNPKAKSAVYQTDLTSQPVAGFVKIEPRRPFALSIRNKQLRVDLHPKSGQIGKMAFPWEPFQATLD